MIKEKALAQKNTSDAAHQYHVLSDNSHSKKPQPRLSSSVYGYFNFWMHNDICDWLWHY